MTIRALVTVLLTSVLLVPAAAAAPESEAQPDCESTQPWIGYRTTMPLMENYTALGSPGGLHPCEGEHWDGQDPIEAEADACSGSVRPDPQALHAGLCMQADPNAMSGEDPTNPLGARLSADGTGALYAAATVALVGRVALYADEGMIALYVRDNTPGNVLWTILFPRWWPPYLSENDCDQATYQHGAMTGQPLCSRENTAITLEHGLLP